MKPLKAILRPRGLAMSSVQTIGATAGMLALNLLTGVMVARILGSEGRGEIAAIITLGQTLGWVASFGCFQAVVFANSRDPENADATLGTWLLLTLPLGLLGVVVGQLIVAPLFSAQSDTTVALARVWLLLIPLMPLSEVLSGSLVADRDFSAMNFYKVLQSALPAAIYVLLWLSGLFTVEAVLITHVTVVAVYLTLLLRRSRLRHRFGRPQRKIARSGLWFGARALFSSFGAHLNARLDLMIMPAFLLASQIGLYAVAVSVATMIVTLAGSLAMIALPVAAKAEKGSDRRVAQVLHATALTGSVFALVVAVLAPLLLKLVYGNEFESAGQALRLLAPGAVFLAMCNILINGLYGKDRPALAGSTQLPGVAITVVGLLLFLRSGGIEAAAAISTVAYTLSFLLAAVAFMRHADLSWRELVDVRPTVWLAVSRLRSRVQLHRSAEQGAA